MKVVINGYEIEGTPEEVKQLISMSVAEKPPVENTLVEEMREMAYEPKQEEKIAVDVDEETIELSNIDNTEYNPDEPLYYEYESGRKQWFWDAVYRAAEHVFLTENVSISYALSKVAPTATTSKHHDAFRDYLRKRGHAALVEERKHKPSHVESTEDVEEDTEQDVENESHHLYMRNKRPALPLQKLPVYIKRQNYFVEDWPDFKTRTGQETKNLQALFGDIVCGNIHSANPYTFNNYGIRFQEFPADWVAFLDEFEARKAAVAGYFGKPDGFRVLYDRHPVTGKRRQTIIWDAAEKTE